MGNPRGFLDYKREDLETIAPQKRIENYKEFYKPLTKSAQEIQGGRCMNCGVAFCQTGIIAQGQKIEQNPIQTAFQTTHNARNAQESHSVNHSAIGCTEEKAERISGGEVGCPLQNLIPEWNDLIYRGLWSEAYDRLSLTNPFPDFTGKICPAPCEDSCVCAINTHSVTIKNNELAIIENAFSAGLVKPYTPKKRSGKKVAIIGSGPAGLACAWELNAQGHNVVVYERSDRAGGLLMYGIPDMKLEKSFVERRIEILRQSEIEFKLNQNIDTPQKAQELEQKYDAVVLATGASKPIDLQIEGRELEGVMFALDFLTLNTKSLLDSHKGAELAKDKNVLIIGSGDTSVDCVAVALRQRAKSITRFERSPKRPDSRPSSNPWPLKKQTFSTDYGLKEAIAHFGNDPRQYQKLTKKFVGKNGKVSGVVACDLHWSTESGKPVSSEVKDSQKEYKADLVLLAMGFSGAEDNLAKNFGIALDKYTNIQTHAYATSNPKIYACGDARSGQSLVVWAIKDGILCARALHKKLLKGLDSK
ncbi:glutamate synthase subunit beta [Helicobacter himalayensis]|uniref:glutamate synthase subunit beta n=1 Tax=Helicobacter himalayensis TaxID=1591088 RepID=UPI000834EFE1|nr:glutamate synthase subunit beta [Helicobacter himalayensis]